MSEKMDTINNTILSYSEHSVGSEKLSEIIKSIFPEKYEEKYSKLVNLIIDYQDTVRKIENGNYSNNKTSVSVEKTSEEVEKIKNEIKELDIIVLNIDKQIANIPIDEPSHLREMLMDQLISINKTRMNLQSKISSITIKNQKGIDDISSNNYDLSKLEIKLKEIVEEIENALKEIQEISINGKDRLDNINVKESHLNEIDEVLNSYDTYKSLDVDDFKKESTALKYFVLQTIKMRKEMYKFGEKLGTKIVDKYKEREIVPSNDQDMNTINASVLITTSFQINDVVRFELPFIEEFLKRNRINYKRLINIADSFSVMSDLIEKNNNDENTIEDVKETIEKLDELGSRGNKDNFEVGKDIFIPIDDITRSSAYCLNNIIVLDEKKKL